LTPLGKWNSYVSNYLLRISLQYDTITDIYANRLPAIQAGCIDLNRFPRKKPADRQRFKRSLAKPFLLTFDSNAKLGGKIVKRRERSDEIRTGGKPSGDSPGKKLMKDLPALLHGDAQFFRYFCIMWRLPGLNHALHNEMKGFIQFTEVIHDLPLLIQNYLLKMIRK
jgi:hypothetical protein